MINRVSQSLIHMMSHLKQMNLPCRDLILSAFETTMLLGTVPLKVRDLVSDILQAFQKELIKIRLCLQTLNWFANGQTGEDAFLGLELQARERLKQPMT